MLQALKEMDQITIGEATERPICIAIAAMGGQGGGVLTNWLISLAENHGWVAQSTSVPGVAQRTGATIYYVEMMRPIGGKKPILAQMPTPGDVDIVIASEFMEAGRSLLRGFVTPNRTTLIASSHRSLAIDEKIAPGEGIADSGAVVDAIALAAKQQIIFDMDALAIRHGSVMSSAMFGALAGSGQLPFPREAFHDVIKADGRGVAASLRTFGAAFERAAKPNAAAAEAAQADVAAQSTDRSEADEVHPRLQPLLAQITANIPAEAQAMARAGLDKVVNFQDLAYGEEYLQLLSQVVATDRQNGGETQAYRLSSMAAKYLANAMAYDDVIRVADLKTHADRYDRIAKEVAAGSDQILSTTEYMHPRMEELAGLLPAKLALWLKSKEGLYQWLDRRVNKGRRVQTYTLGSFLMLYILGGLRSTRRASLRHAEEVAHRDAWLEYALDMAAKNYDLAVEILQNQRLIKGYSDTHSRGLSKFDRVMAEIQRISHRPDAADWARRLRETAVKDGEDVKLNGLIQTMQSFD